MPDVAYKKGLLQTEKIIDLSRATTLDH